MGEWESRGVKGDEREEMWKKNKKRGGIEKGRSGRRIRRGMEDE